MVATYVCCCLVVGSSGEVNPHHPHFCIHGWDNIAIKAACFNTLLLFFNHKKVTKLFIPNILVIHFYHCFTTYFANENLHRDLLFTYEITRGRYVYIFVGLCISNNFKWNVIILFEIIWWNLLKHVLNFCWYWCSIRRR